jgi:hypothetical protein
MAEATLSPAERTPASACVTTISSLCVGKADGSGALAELVFFLVMIFSFHRLCDTMVCKHANARITVVLISSDRKASPLPVLVHPLPLSVKKRHEDSDAGIAGWPNAGVYVQYRSRPVVGIELSYEIRMVRIFSLCCAEDHQETGWLSCHGA